MTDPLYLLALVGFAPALVSVLIAVLFKYYIKPHKPDTFKQTLKFGLLGTLLGLVIFGILWTIHKNETNSWAAPGDISIIPFYTMLAGVMLGVYLTNRTAFTTGKASSYGALGFVYLVLGIGFDNPYSKAVFLIVSLLFFGLALRVRLKNKAAS
ncbi:hypothetical protein [Spirosoma aerophilum]